MRVGLHAADLSIHPYIHVIIGTPICTVFEYPLPHPHPQPHPYPYPHFISHTWPFLASVHHHLPFTSALISPPCVGNQRTRSSTTSRQIGHFAVFLPGTFFSVAPISSQHALQVSQSVVASNTHDPGLNSTYRTEDQVATRYEDGVCDRAVTDDTRSIDHHIVRFIHRLRLWL